MHVLIFQHTEEEKPGTLLDWLRDRGHASTVHHWYAQGTAPDLDRYDALVVLGGPMNLDEETKHPWLIPEKAAIRQWIASGKPLLGICLGGQLLAQSLGAHVGRGEAREIGFQLVNKTAANHPAFRRWPASLPVYQYHEDAFTLPEGCVSLATSPVCAHQAFARGSNLLGLQFHPESTAEWIRGNEASIVKGAGETYVQMPRETEALVPTLLPPMTDCFFRLLDDFFGQ